MSRGNVCILPSWEVQLITPTPTSLKITKCLPLLSPLSSKFDSPIFLGGQVCVFSLKSAENPLNYNDTRRRSYYEQILCFRFKSNSWIMATCLLKSEQIRQLITATSKPKKNIFERKTYKHIPVLEANTRINRVALNNRGVGSVVMLKICLKTSMEAWIVQNE